MKQLPILLKQNRILYLTFLCFFLVASIFILPVPKADSFIEMNSFHSLALHVLFVNYTFFGDGFFSVGLCVLLFFTKQKKLALYIMVAYLFSGLTAQLIKNLVYAPRPAVYFEATQYLFKLDNFANNGHGVNSFPSGHTTSAFSLVTVLAIHFKTKIFSILLLIAAVIVGYSRIYLAQHFPVDVLAGAFVGLAFATAAVVVLDNGFAITLRKKIKGLAHSKNAHPGTAINY